MGKIPFQYHICDDATKWDIDMALFSPFENLFPLFVFTVAPFKHDPPNSNPNPTNFVYILTSTAEIVRYA